MRDISIVKYNPQTATYTLGYNPNAAPAKGRLWLVQSIVKSLLTLKGSNILSAEHGEHFMSLFGVLDAARAQEVKEAFPSIIKGMKDRILEEQEEDESLQAEEKLVDLKISSVEYDSVTSAWLVDLIVTTDDGVTSNISI